MVFPRTEEEILDAMTIDREAVGLALSGGGFRAALFHIGSLIRLNELGLLSKLLQLVSVSGGSIAAAHLGLIWPKLRFENDVAVNLKETFVEPLRKFCAQNLEKKILYYACTRPWRLRSPGNFLEQAYRSEFFGSQTLQDLPDVPEIAVTSTDLLSESSFLFSKAEARDHNSYVTIPRPRFLISECVAASSAFPPVLSPFRLHLKEGDIDSPETC